MRRLFIDAQADGRIHKAAEPYGIDGGVGQIVDDIAAKHDAEGQPVKRQVVDIQIDKKKDKRNVRYKIYKGK